MPPSDNPDFDPEEDDPTLEASWPHLTVSLTPDLTPDLNPDLTSDLPQLARNCRFFPLIHFEFKTIMASLDINLRLFQYYGKIRQIFMPYFFGGKL